MRRLGHMCGAHSEVASRHLQLQRRLLRARHATVGAVVRDHGLTAWGSAAPGADCMTPSAVSAHTSAEMVPAEPRYDELGSVVKAGAEDSLKGSLRDSWSAFFTALNAAHAASDACAASRLVAQDLVSISRCSAQAELERLLLLLPEDMRNSVVSHAMFDPLTVEEVYVHLGQSVEVRGANWYYALPPPTPECLSAIIRRIGRFGDDGRGCVAGTAHRVSVWRGRRGESLGVTMRVGRYIPHAARALVPLLQHGSLLILSRAGAGKTTLLRDLAAALARDPSRPRVLVIDTSNEIGGDNAQPLPYLGRGRRLQVPRRDDQLRIMTEGLQNHSPEYMIVDEVATALEAEAAWSISQRGVRLIATCHGESLARLLQNQALNLLVGGAAQAFLSNEERRLRNKIKKTILERPHASPFEFVLELQERSRGRLYYDVNKAVDMILDDRNPCRDASVGCTIDLEESLPDHVLAKAVSIVSGAGEPSRRSTREGVVVDEGDADDGFGDLASLRGNDDGIGTGKDSRRDQHSKYHGGGNRHTQRSDLHDGWGRGRNRRHRTGDQGHGKSDEDVLRELESLL